MATTRYELNFGSANAGLTPTFEYFVNQLTGSALTQPTIYESSFAHGSYYFDWDWATAPCQTVSYMATLSGIELADVISGLPAPGTSVATAGTSSLAGYQTVGALIARAAVQVGALALTRSQVFSYDPFSATDANITSMLEHLDTLGMELAGELKTHLERVFTITTSGSSTVYTMPTDYVEIAEGTQWNTSLKYPLWGPVSPQSDRYLNAWNGSVTVQIPYRIKGNLFYFPVAPPNGTTITGVYYSRYWVQTAASSTPDCDRVVNATDYVLFDPSLVVLGLRYKFLADKNMDVVAALADYERRLEWAKAALSGARIITIGADATGIRLLDANNVPATGMGTP